MVPAALLPFQLPSNKARKAVGEGSHTWAAATQVEDLNGVPGSWLWPNPAPAVGSTWGVNRKVEDLSVFLFLLFSFGLSNTLKEKKKKRH